MKVFVIFLGMLFFCGHNVFSQDNKMLYDAPDQVIYHAKSKTWFVSNLGGGINLARDNYGWISRTNQNGDVIAPFWIGKKEGFHAPSGMAIKDDFLYVVDRDGVYKIDIELSSVVRFFPIADGKFLNDIAVANNGDIYVSDFYANKIFKIEAVTNKVFVWLESDSLKSPDGLYIDGGNLIVASWGVLSSLDSFDTLKLGDLLKINLNSKEIIPLVKELGNLEGITKNKDSFFITDWSSGKLLKVNSDTLKVEEFMLGLKHPTDLFYAKEIGVLGLPQHGTNQVIYLKIK